MNNSIKVAIIIVSVCLLLPVVYASVSISDRAEVRESIEQIATSVNSNDIDMLLAVLSPSARDGLEEELRESFSQGVIHFEQRIASFEYREDNYIRVVGTFTASGFGWSISGFPNEFTFEKVDDAWLLYDTNFHKKLNREYIFDTFGRFFEMAGTFLLILFPVMILLWAFWLWMLIDSLSRTYDDKVMWVLLIVFLSTLGALIYFFAIRRKLVRQSKASQESKTA